MTELTGIRKKLDSEYVHGYGPSALPNEIDEEVERLVNLSLAAPDADGVLADLTQTHGMVLLAFAERMSSLAIRERRLDVVSKGMEALRIASGVVYEKELLPILALLHNSAMKLGADWSRMIPVTPGFEETRFNVFCESFLSRSAADSSIEAMGFIEGEDDGGFRYLRTW